VEVFKGPLGSHRNFINHMALANYQDYQTLCGLNKENGKQQTPDKYKEFRYFLNAVESFNNILDYFYYENESELGDVNLTQFKRKVFVKYPILEELSDLANAYKHCIREKRERRTRTFVKNTELAWAKDLQKPEINVDINISHESGVGANVTYNFNWPIPENEKIINNVFLFWLDYIQPNDVDLINV